MGTFKQLLLVGLGGFLGSLGRYKLGGWILHYTPDGRFPLGTFVVNVLGCLLIGVVAGLAEKRDLISPELRLLLIPGFLGGFTTFSAFGLEGVSLLRRGEWLMATSYAGASVVCGLAAVWVGMRLAGVMGRES